MLNQLFPHMYDSPEHHQALAGLTYGVVPFLVLPFTFMLLIIGVDDVGPYLALEYLFQAINFTAMVAVFRTYLQDSWLSATTYPKRFWAVCLGAAAVIAAVWIGYVCAFVWQTHEDAALVVNGALPMTGIELMLLPGQFVSYGGIPAVLFVVFLGPVITSCLFYATAFAPVCVSGHRFLAYAAVAALTAVPRIITWFTIWGGWKEPQLYLAQLPIHLLACWTYEKTDTIWAPIVTHAIANAIICAAIYGIMLLGG